MKAILACDSNFGIGLNGTLPWPRNSDDLKEFRNLTTGHYVLMGSKTWNDKMFPKPLPNRKNFILSRNPEFKDSRGYVISQNHHETIELLIEEASQENKEIWVIGGAEIIEMLYFHIKELHLSVFVGEYDCDKFIRNPLDMGFTEKSFEVRSDCTKYIFVKQFTFLDQGVIIDSSTQEGFKNDSLDRG